jgi:hypothetical protein
MMTCHVICVDVLQLSVPGSQLSLSSHLSVLLRDFARCRPPRAVLQLMYVIYCSLVGSVAHTADQL